MQNSKLKTQSRSLKLKIKSPVAKRHLNFDFGLLRFEFNNGYAAITATLIVLSASLTIVAGLTFFALQEVGASRAYVKSVQAGYAAESGTEDYLYRIMSGRQTGGSENLAVGTAATGLNLTIPAQGQYIIRARGTQDKFNRNLETRLNLPIVNSSFIFGSVVGDGGLEMSNNSQIQGSIFSNGNIIGAAGTTVTGDAFVAETARIDTMIINGNAQANLLKNSTVGLYATSSTQMDTVTVGGSAHAYELIKSNIARDAYYTVIDGQTSVGGNSYPNSPAPPTLVKQAMPITAEKISQLKSDARDLGTISSGDCSQTWSPPADPYTLNGGVLNQNLLLDNHQVLIMKGTIWVKCNVTISNGASIRLDPSYGPYSGVLIANGWMNLNNNGVFSGSGDPDSFVMLISSSGDSGPSGVAINVSNNVVGVIFYAQNGTIFLNNGVTATELTGWKVKLDNNATLIYNPSLVNTNFSSGHYRIKYWNRVP